MKHTPCPWPLDVENAACEVAALKGLTEAQQALVIDMAVHNLWSWTGRRVGLCPEVVRPCRADRAERGSTFWGAAGGDWRPGRAAGWVPVLVAGQWFNVGCGSCLHSCGCGPDVATSIRLPGPVEEVVEVWIGGSLLDPAAYTLRGGVLYRIDGGTWPLGNHDLDSPQAEGSRAWEITYTRGLPVTPGAQLAALTLANEIAKAVCNDKSCALPQRVQSVTRQGVTIGTMVDSFEDMKDGKTGIWVVDSWVAAENAPRPSPPRIGSPDARGGRGLMESLAYRGGAL